MKDDFKKGESPFQQVKINIKISTVDQNSIAIASSLSTSEVFKSIIISKPMSVKIQELTDNIIEIIKPILHGTKPR